jgi:hypothetical protein
MQRNITLFLTICSIYLFTLTAVAQSGCQDSQATLCSCAGGAGLTGPKCTAGPYQVLPVTAYCCGVQWTVCYGLKLCPANALLQDEHVQEQLALLGRSRMILVADCGGNYVALDQTTEEIPPFNPDKERTRDWVIR